MKSYVYGVARLLCALGVAGCAAGSTSEDIESVEGADKSSGLAEQAATFAPVQQYFSITRDLRLCASPRCGGYFVKAVNLARTTCADGTVAESCYVSEIDYKILGGNPNLNAATTIVKGKLQLVSYPNIGKFGKLIAEDVFGSATANPANGTFYRLKDTGIVCFAAPCFNVRAEALNLGTTTTLSSYDFRKVGASPSQLLRAEAALDAGRLIAAGSITSDSTTIAAGRHFTATQFYLPARNVCTSSNDCSVAEECNASTVCLPPPGCGELASCPTVCTGYCIPRVANCISSSDCAVGQYCDNDPCLPPPGCTPGSICPTVCGGVCAPKP